MKLFISSQAVILQVRWRMQTCQPAQSTLLTVTYLDLHIESCHTNRLALEMRGLEAEVMRL